MGHLLVVCFFNKLNYWKFPRVICLYLFYLTKDLYDDEKNYYGFKYDSVFGVS